jgi:hypothetical protein
MRRLVSDEEDVEVEGAGASEGTGVEEADGVGASEAAGVFNGAGNKPSLTERHHYWFHLFATC